MPWVESSRTYWNKPGGPGEERSGGKGIWGPEKNRALFSLSIFFFFFNLEKPFQTVRSMFIGGEIEGQREAKCFTMLPSSSLDNS